LESELHCYALGLPRPLSKRIGRWLDRRIPPWADHIVAATTSIRDKLVRHGRCKPEQITVVSTGVEWEHFLTAGDVDAAHPCSPKILVFSGNLAPYQGIPLLFKAFQHIRQVRQDVRLLMLTDSPGVEYRGLAARLGIEQFIDFVDSDFERLPYHLGRADIALNPRTEGDGLPGKLLNYMAAGKPIVSFAGSAHCLIHGKTGWIVDEPNERLFAEAVLHLLQDPALACRLGTNAQVHVQQQYSWNQATDKLEHIYGHVAAIHERLATTRASQQRL
jgi:glycosyltransferase involved in cell wall biosynthesis